ncbi:iron ABC transporter permease [Klebsiella sp. BIGb0407]|uniref:FecCD family ABC transporter permease n=1 Tax=Klebsiella sp. BIGb0407 TaxID=2940603 RepID=UPI002168B268|nr:iron ABC transporter permease [Klebsiella sp. BIGb0407]MCS3431801.1 iron complex transport system permease protein [Klebsiella sp. BIGb0407]
MPDSQIFRCGPLQREYSPALLPVFLLCCTATLLIIVSALSIGEVVFSLPQTLKLLFEPDTSAQSFILHELRLPRVILALLAGGGLGIAGLIMQTLVRNPLASPDTLGVTTGASVGALVWLSFFSLKYGSSPMPYAAMTGAAVAVGLIFLLSWRSGATPLRLILTGVGVSALAGAGVTLILVFSPLTTTFSAWVWLSGSVYAASWEKVRQLLGIYLWALPILLMLLRYMKILQLNDHLAIGLGVSIHPRRILLLLACVILSGGAISLVGAMAFVGLIAPHLARLIVRSGFFSQLLITACCGGCMVIIADLLARTLFLPADLPAGIFVALAGAPLFLWLLIRQRT